MKGIVIRTALFTALSLTVVIIGWLTEIYPTTSAVLFTVNLLIIEAIGFILIVYQDKKFREIKERNVS